MKVKIIKSRKPTYWYSSEIGKTFEVEDIERNGHYNVKNTINYIEKQDCEIIPDKIKKGTIMKSTVIDLKVCFVGYNKKNSECFKGVVLHIVSGHQFGEYNEKWIFSKFEIEKK